jgi:hypothetical protein
MRSLKLAVVAVGAVLVFSPVAWAQQKQGDQGGGVGDPIDRLNRAINPDSNQNQARAREDNRSSSTRNDRRGSDYRHYSDRELRNESARLDDQERQIQRERQAIEDEMDRRGVRR